MADANNEAVKGEDEQSQNAHSTAKMKESRMNKPIAETMKLFKPQVIDLRKIISPRDQNIHNLPCFYLTTLTNCFC
jgi:hypothetical protein